MKNVTILFLSLTQISVQAQEVHPLIEDNWASHTWPYNALNPVNPETGKRFEVSCTELATGRLLNYWNWPIKGKGSEYFRVGDAIFEDIFYETEYEWDKMPNELIYEATKEQYEHIALLLRHVTTATKGYANGGNITGVTSALINNFRMKNTLQVVNRNDFSREEWIALAKNELDNGRPIYVEGITQDSPLPNGNVAGHAFLCDGYNEEEHFHLLFGWGGAEDGYYDIDNFGGFPKNNKFIIGLEPDTLSSDTAFEVHFTCSAANGTFPMIVSFQDKSINSGNNPSWLWNFGDGTTSTETNPDHTYTSKGKYTVSLLVTSGTTEKEVSKEDYIIVTEKVAASISDSLALVAFYNENNGANWINNENWLTGPLSTWYGVGIEDNRVTSLSLYTYSSKFGVAGVLSNELTKLTALKYLRLSNNELTGGLPQGIGNLTKLEELILDGNSLNVALSESIGELTSLKFFSLAFNQIPGELPETIGNLRNLIKLDLTNNLFSGKIPSSIGNCSKLEYIVLNKNSFSGTIPETIGALKALKLFFIEYNNFSGALPATLVNLINLERMGIGDNKLEDLPDLSSFEKLSFFTLTDNYFTFEDLEANMNINFPEFDANGAPYTFAYAPQKTLSDTSLIYNNGDEFILNPEIGGTQNSYKWYKDGNELNNTDNILTLGKINETCVGTYYCEVQNSKVPNLTIRSRNFVVSVIKTNCYELTAQATICEGETYKFGSRILSESGEYTEVFNSSTGCDSVVVLSLIISSIDKPIITQIADTLICNVNGVCSWYCNNKLIEGVNTSKYVAKESGNYQVIVTNENDCDSPPSESLSVVLTNIQSLDFLKNIVVFPNPVNDEINIKGLGTEETFIQLFDSSGRNLYNQKITSTKTKINMKGFSSGLYNLIIIKGINRNSYKIIK